MTSTLSPLSPSQTEAAAAAPGGSCAARFDSGGGVLHPPPTDALHLEAAPAAAGLTPAAPVTERIIEAAQAACGLWLTSAETQELAQLAGLWRDFAAEFAGFGERFHATLDGLEARQGRGAFDRRRASHGAASLGGRPTTAPGAG